MRLGMENATNRASTVNNIYLKLGEVIRLKDNTTYKYGVYRQTGENVVSSGAASDCLTNGWITTSFTIPSDGWYGIAFSRNDNSNFNFNGVDSTVIDDYLSSYEVSVDKGNGYATRYGECNK